MKVENALEYKLWYGVLYVMVQKYLRKTSLQSSQGPRQPCRLNSSYCIVFLYLKSKQSPKRFSFLGTLIVQSETWQKKTHLTNLQFEVQCWQSYRPASYSHALIFTSSSAWRSAHFLIHLYNKYNQCFALVSYIFVLSSRIFHQ